MEPTQTPSAPATPPSSAPSTPPPSKHGQPLLLAIIILLALLIAVAIFVIVRAKKELVEQRNAFNQQVESMQEQAEETAEAARDRIQERREDREERRDTDEEDTEPGTVSTEEETSTYENETFDVSFSFPASFSVTSDAEVMTYSTGEIWYKVVLENTDDAQSPWMSFEISPDGYGPIFPDEIYELAQNSDGSISILSRDVQPVSELSDDGKTIITASLEANDGTNYFWLFRYEDGETDWSLAFDDILITTILP